MMTFDARKVARAMTGSISIDRFNERLREQRATRFERAIEAPQLELLFDLPRMETLFVSGAIPIGYVDIYEGGHLKRLADMQNKSGKTSLAVVADRFREGATIRLRDVDTFDLRLSQFVAEVRRQFAAQSQANVYLTPAGAAGFPPHFDITDVFIVQCAGAKEWRIFDDYSSRIDLPLTETNWEPDRYRPIGSPDPMMLSAGDVLYLPRGVMHQTSCTDRASMHLTISITPLTFADLIARELRRVASTHVGLRQRVPWCVDAGDHAEAARIADVVHSHLRALATELDVAAVIQNERRSIQPDDPGSDTSARPDVGGILSRLFEAPADHRSGALTGAETLDDTATSR